MKYTNEILYQQNKNKRFVLLKINSTDVAISGDKIFSLVSY
jgi:hypothetical protein